MKSMSKLNSNTKKLSPKQQEELLKTLKTRFENNKKTKRQHCKFGMD
jgi:hypothetical protein